MTPNEEPTTEAGWRAASQRLHESGDDEPYATDIPATPNEEPTTEVLTTGYKRDPLVDALLASRDDLRLWLTNDGMSDGPDAHTIARDIRAAIEAEARATATPSRETGLTAAGTALLREWGPSDDMEGSAHSDFRAAIRKVEAEARATATPGLCSRCGYPDRPNHGCWGYGPARTTPTPGLDVLLGSLDEDDVMYDYPVAQSGEPMDPVPFVRWDAIRATATALMGLYEAVGAAPAVRETPRQRKVLEAWKAVRAALPASGETEA